MMDETVREPIDSAWKKSLISQMITSISGSPAEQTKANYEVGRYYLTQAPASLFKYYSDDKLNVDTIESGKMWFSAPCNFNDIFDCRIAVNREAILNSAIRESSTPIKQGSPLWVNLRNQIWKTADEIEQEFHVLRQTIGVSCFSETYDSVLMWSHYANKHRGFCAEYNIMNMCTQLSFTAAPVLYSEDSVALSEIDQSNVKYTTVNLFIRSLFTKALEWSYEREWRIIRDQSACGDNWDDKGKGALLNMVMPTSLILGSEVDLELQKRVEQYCEANKIDLYKMEKDSVRFKLMPKSLHNYSGNSLYRY